MIESNVTFVVAAYAVTWITLLGYLFRLFRKDKLACAALDRASRDTGGPRT